MIIRFLKLGFSQGTFKSIVSFTHPEGEVEENTLTLTGMFSLELLSLGN
jgi:hypothetical protein